MAKEYRLIRVGRKVILIDKESGCIGMATCSYDDEYDFTTGFSIALQRLDNHIDFRIMKGLVKDRGLKYIILDGRREMFELLEIKWDKKLHNYLFKLNIDGKEEYVTPDRMCFGSTLECLDGNYDVDWDYYSGLTKGYSEKHSDIHDFIIRDLFETGQLKIIVFNDKCKDKTLSAERHNLLTVDLLGVEWNEDNKRFMLKFMGKDGYAEYSKPEYIDWKETLKINGLEDKKYSTISSKNFNRVFDKSW